MGVFLETQCPGGGGGGYSGFQLTARDHNDLFMTGMIGDKNQNPKIKTQKNP